MQYDDYPDLPALPRAVQLACASIEPEHLLLPPSGGGCEPVHSPFRDSLHPAPREGGSRDDHVPCQRVVQEALNDNGDVTASD